MQSFDVAILRASREFSRGDVSFRVEISFNFEFWEPLNSLWNIWRDFKTIQHFSADKFSNCWKPLRIVVAEIWFPRPEKVSCEESLSEHCHRWSNWFNKIVLLISSGSGWTSPTVYQLTLPFWQRLIKVQLQTLNEINAMRNIFHWFDSIHCL